MNKNLILFSPLLIAPFFLYFVWPSHTGGKASNNGSITVELPAANPYISAPSPEKQFIPTTTVPNEAPSETKKVHVDVPTSPGKDATVVTVPVQQTKPIETPLPVTPLPVKPEPGPLPVITVVAPAPPVRRSVSVTPVAYDGPRSSLKPDYPPMLRESGIEGRVSVRVTVGPGGRPVLIQPLGNPDVRLFSLTKQFGMKHWHFKPATVAGIPGTGTIVISLDYRISDS